MGFIEDELLEVRKLCEHLVPGAKLVSCVPAMVRVEIRRTAVKAITVCIQFPIEYPRNSALLELKSKSISETLLKKLTEICENEVKKYLGKPQVLKIVQFIRSFIDDNPLSCCYEEIIQIKKYLQPRDELKLKQKTSSIHLRIVKANYYIKAKIVIPDNYPEKAVVPEIETNFPPVLERFIIGQGKEIIRQCVEPPLFKGHKKKQLQQEQPANATCGSEESTQSIPGRTWKPSTTLWPLAHHCFVLVRELPIQQCQICHVACLPQIPEDAVVDETDDKHVERIYCGHLYHQSCLINYMKTPPFKGGKKCVACGQRIYHEKWRVGDRLAENRWAHQEARNRELEEVQDFFK